MEKSLDDIEKEIESKLNEMKNTDNISGKDKANAIMNLAKNPEELIRVVVSDKVANKVKTDDKTIQRIDKTVDKILDSATTTIENEGQESENKSNSGKLQAYFQLHKEELKTAGIDAPTYLEDMERGVKWHKKWSKFHWCIFGWWMTGIRTIFMKAKPFKLWLNIMAIILCLSTSGLAIWGIIELIKFIK